MKTMDPEFAKLIHGASGIIAETGSVTTHLASIARESGKVAIVNAKGATRTLVSGEMITLDGDHGRVYKGYIESLIKAKLCQRHSDMSNDRNLPYMRQVLKHIVPLNLTDLQEDVVLEASVHKDDFKTIHDVIRFVHEASVREMFQMGSKGESDVSHILVDPKVPLTFYIIDIEGGLMPKAVFKRRITPMDIQSKPFLALWKGMTHESVSWTGPPRFNLGGFFSVMSRSFIEGSVSEKGGKAYVILSRDYLNFHCRLAYHFTVIDCVCGEDSSNNYITFRFEGGGAGADGRIRRVHLLRDILETFYFRVEIKGDFLTAVFRGGSVWQTESRLDQLGKLMAFTRQLDMTLTDDDTTKRYVKAFLNEDYKQSLMDKKE
jgi:pyruvate,water dikinase